MIILDAGTLIALFKSQDAHHAWAVQVFSQTTDHEWAMSSINMAEAMVHPARANAVQVFQQRITGLEIRVLASEMPGENPANAAARLAGLRAATGLRMPDVLALDLAIRHQAILATPDAELAAAARSVAVSALTPSSTSIELSKVIIES